METRQGVTWIAGKDTPAKTWITRVVNFGTREEWQDMKERMTPEEIRAALEEPLRGQWTRHGKAFAEVVFNCHLPEEILIDYHARHAS